MRQIRTTVLQLVTAMLAISLLAACATKPASLEALERKDSCPANTVLLCEERFGKKVRCYCKHEDKMREVFDPFAR